MLVVHPSSLTKPISQVPFLHVFTSLKETPNPQLRLGNDGDMVACLDLKTGQVSLVFSDLPVVHHPKAVLDLDPVAGYSHTETTIPLTKPLEPSRGQEEAPSPSQASQDQGQDQDQDFFTSEARQEGQDEEQVLDPQQKQDRLERLLRERYEIVDYQGQSHGIKIGWLDDAIRQFVHTKYSSCRLIIRG